MDWDAVAAISEALGAVGVFVTVIYVGFQIRQNTKSIQGATEQALMSAEMDLYGLWAQHASVTRRGSIDLAELDPDERETYGYLVSAEMSQLYGAFVQYQRKLIPDSVWEAYLNSWRAANLNKPGFLQTWSEIKTSWPVEFSQCLEAAVKRSE
jgi:hypothetical protein